MESSVQLLNLFRFKSKLFKSHSSTSEYTDSDCENVPAVYGCSLLEHFPFMLYRRGHFAMSFENKKCVVFHVLRRVGRNSFEFSNLIFQCFMANCFH